MGILILPILGQSKVIGSPEEDATLITIHAEDAFLPSILAILAKESGYNIVTDPNVNKQDKVSIHLDEVPIEQAINLIVRAVGLSYEVVGNSFLVADPKKLKEEVGVTSYVLTLKYAAAEDVKNLLQDISEQVQVDIPGNKLLVHASPKKIAEIIKVVESIDVPAIQIMLETRLIEVAADVEEQLGIDWSKISSYKTILAEGGVPLVDGGGSIIPDDQTLGNVPATMPFNRLSGLLAKDKTGILPKYFSRQLTVFDITLDMLLKNNQAEVLADSRLTTINGREASIKLVDIVPYILSSGGVGGQVQVQREEVGIKLNILPTVNTDGYITVKVDPEVSTIFEFIGPDANIILDFALVRLNNILNNMIIYPKRMILNLNITKGNIFSQEIMLELTKSGISREKSYRIIQSHIKKCLFQNLNLFEVVKKDKQIMDKIPLNKLKKIFNYSSHFKNINLIFNRVFK